MKKLLSIILLACIFGFAGCSKQSALEAAPIRIAYLPVIHALPLYVAVERGYFKDAGLEVKLTSFQAPNQIIDALLSGNVDIGGPSSTATGITAISQTKKPNSLKIFSFGGANKQIINDLLIANRESPIANISELRGKRIGILPGIQWRTIATEILNKNGISASEVQIIDVAPTLQVQALAAKQVEALLTVEPTRAIAFARGIGVDIEKTPVVNNIADPFYGGCGVVTTSFANKYPKQTKEIINIIKKAADFIEADPEVAKSYLSKYTSLTSDLAQNVDLPLFKSVDQLEPNDIKAIQDFLDIFYRHKIIQEKVVLNDLLLR